VCSDTFYFYLECNIKKNSSSPSGQTPPKHSDEVEYLRMLTQLLAPNSVDEINENNLGI
jgi:hypothetical protein